MSAESHAIEVETKGHNQVLDITDQVVQCVDAGAISCGIATVFVIGSTAAITTTEFEPGLASHDLAAALEELYLDRDLRLKLGRFARERAEQLYHWDKLGEFMMGIYASAVASASIK